MQVEREAAIWREHKENFTNKEWRVQRTENRAMGPIQETKEDQGGWSVVNEEHRNLG